MAQKIKKMSKKFIALVCMITLVFSVSVVDKTDAATIATDVKMTLSDSRANTNAITYTIDFTGAATTLQCVKILFRDAATGGSAPTGLVTTSGVEGTWTGLTAASWASVFTTDDQITLTWGASSENASGGVSLGFTTIENQDSAGILYAQITTYSDVACSTVVDTGVAAAAIIGGVVVEAKISESLTFAVSGKDTTACAAVTGISTDATSTSTSVDFGAIDANTQYDICQSLSVSTNATDGYNVTIQETDQLKTASSTEIADGACDATCTDAVTDTWILTTDAAAGFGYCVEDGTGDAAVTAPTSWTALTQCNNAGSAEFKTIADAGASEAAQNIMSSAGPVSGDETYINFRLLVPATQGAGTYTNEIAYIVTPTFN